MPELAELRLTADYINKSVSGLKFVNIRKNPVHKGKEIEAPFKFFNIIAESRGKELMLTLKNVDSDEKKYLLMTMGMLNAQNNLVYNQTINLELNTGQEVVVPDGKTWKIEAIGVGAKDSSQYITGFSNNSSPSIFTSPIYITNVGQNNWTVPPNITSICVEVWGGGGNGDLMQGGSGGGYGYQCFQVTPGTNYTLTVGGSGGTTTFDTLLTATGGSDGNATIQQGGSSTAFYSITGTVANSIDGASGANGGAGGRGMYYDCSSGNCVWRPARNGNIPGGGGGGYRSGYSNTGLGARGQINIYF